MKPIVAVLPFVAAAFSALAVEPPVALASRSGDQSVVLHWDAPTNSAVAGYRVYRAFASDGPFSSRTPTPLTTRGFADLSVSNQQTHYYRVTTLATGGQESQPSATVAVVPRAFADDDAFLDYVQQVHFDYFWYGANLVNGLIPDRLPSLSPCSIAAVGFGLSAICIGIDHGWITRSQGAGRVRTTLNTFLQGPQGPESSNVTGYKGWYYHFLDMQTGTRYMPFNSELSSIDTALLLAGILEAKQYFDGASAEEVEIRQQADAIFNRVDWHWMARGSNVLSMGWRPGSGFLSANWAGYNEAMILYCLALGAATNPLPASAWSQWTKGYTWATYSGQSFVPFPPLFGHQYSHCWMDLRHIADAYMNDRESTYFENSRRAALAQRAYCIANPLHRAGYSSNVWGLTASDGPWGYSARGAPPAQNDDGTIAPTAAAASIAFTPEYSLPTMRHFYQQFRQNLWTAYGFRDAFNQGQQWWGPDVLGIDQGPIVLMIENYRTQRVWRRFMRNPEVQRGLEAAGFLPLAFMRPMLHLQPGQYQVSLGWDSQAGRTYQVEYSPDLNAWFGSPGTLVANGATASWTDSGPLVTGAAPDVVAQRFYRVFQLGWP